MGLGFTGSRDVGFAVGAWVVGIAKASVKDGRRGFADEGTDRGYG